MDRRCSQKPINDRNRGSLSARDMTPTIGYLLIDMQYPACESSKKVAI